jgi:hypothetical protein
MVFLKNLKQSHWYYVTLELALFFCCFFLADHYWAEGTRFLHVSPNPLWIAVLLISAQYGSTEGLLAASLSIAALYIYNLPEQQITQNQYDYLLDIVLLPIQWILTAVMIGEMRVRQREEMDSLKQELSITKEREKLVSEAFYRMKKQKESFEITLATQFHTPLMLYEKVRNIQFSDKELFSQLNAIIKESLHVNKFSLFLKKDEELHIASKHGWEESDTYSICFSKESPLFQEVIENKKTISHLNQSEAKLLSEEGILACPIISNKDSSSVIGLLKIEEIPFMHLNLNTLETLPILCEFLSSAYEKYQEKSKELELIETLKTKTTDSLANHTFCLKKQSQAKRLDITMNKERASATNILTQKGEEILSKNEKKVESLGKSFFSQKSL